MAQRAGVLLMLQVPFNDAILRSFLMQSHETLVKVTWQAWRSSDGSCVLRRAAAGRHVSQLGCSRVTGWQLSGSSLYFPVPLSPDPSCASPPSLSLSMSAFSPHLPPPSSLSRLAGFLFNSHSKQLHDLSRTASRGLLATPTSWEGA